MLSSAIRDNHALNMHCKCKWMRINKNLGSNCREIQTKVQYFFSCVAQSKNWATVIIYNNQWLFKCQSWKKKHTNTYQLLSTYTKPHADTHTHMNKHISWLFMASSMHLSIWYANSSTQLYQNMSFGGAKKKACFPPLPIPKYAHLFFCGR